MAEMTKAEIEQIIKDYLSTRQIELKDFTTISGVDGTTYVLLVQPTGTANKMDVNLLKKQLVAEIKEPADLVINEVKEAGNKATLAVEAATKAVSEANTAATSANEAAETAKQAALNVKDGKTPVFGTVTAKGGDKASATYKLNGVDANGNPKYDVAFVLEKGADGKHPVLQSGNITTLAPDKKVEASFRANGYDNENRPIYLVDLAIPKGQTGKDGDGSGNVLVNPAGLKKDVRYLFVPKADGSAEGDFVEAKTSELINDSKFQTDADVNKSIAAFSEMNLIPAFTDKRWSINQRAEIIDRYSLVHTGVTGQGAAMRSHITVSIEPDTSYTLSLKKTGTPDPTIVARLISDQSSQSTVFFDYKTEELVRTFKTEKNSVGILIELGGNSLPSTDGLFFSLLSLKKGTSGVWSPAPEDLTTHQNFMTGSNTITTLSSIPADKRTIIATLSAATNITLKETLEVGKELLISINPTADFEQPLPITGGWQSLDGDTLSLKKDKPAELSILCVGDNKYVLSSKVAE